MVVDTAALRVDKERYYTSLARSVEFARGDLKPWNLIRNDRSAGLGVKSSQHKLGVLASTRDLI